MHETSCSDNVLFCSASGGENRVLIAARTCKLLNSETSGIVLRAAGLNSLKQKKNFSAKFMSRWLVSRRDCLTVRLGWDCLSYIARCCPNTPRNIAAQILFNRKGINCCLWGLSLNHIELNLKETSFATFLSSRISNLRFASLSMSI